MRFRTLGYFVSLLLAAPASASGPEVSIERLKRDMTALSTVEMAGRFPGTEGERRALDYIQKALADAGARPAARRGWLQPVAMTARERQSGRFVLHTSKGVTVDLSDDVIFLGRGQRESMSADRLVYAGHAERRDPAFARSVVFYRDTAPPSEKAPTANDVGTRLATVAASGAKAAIAILSDGSFDNRRARTGPMLMLPADMPLPVRGFIGESAARRLFAAIGEDLSQVETGTAPLLRLGETIEIEVKTKVSRTVSHNLIGAIPGRDPAAGAVLYTAHWDALGRCRTTGETCPGAIDNASGVAGLIEIARLFRQGPSPDRTILLVATTAEEQGLIGSRSYVANPVVPLARTIAAINLDTLPLYRRGQPVGMVGFGLTSADATLTRLAAGQSRTLDPVESAGPVYRNSDAWALLRAGVPAFVLSGAIARAGGDNGAAFREFIAKRVHTPLDVMDAGLTFEGMGEDVELAYRTGFTYARKAAEIKFLRTSPFQRPVKK